MEGAWAGCYRSVFHLQNDVISSLSLFPFFFFLVREMKISEVQLCLFSFMKIKEEKSKNVPYSVCVCMCVHMCGGQRLIIGVHLDF